MLFADRLKTLKECGLDNASDVIDYMDRVKQAIAEAKSLNDGNATLATLHSPTGIQTKIVERSNSAANQNLAVVMFDTRHARNGHLLTDVALRREDRLSLTRTLQIAQERVGTPEIKVIAGFTQGNTVKPVPLRVETASVPLRASSTNLGGRLRDKIALCLLGGRQIQLFSDEALLFQNMDLNRRMALGELGLVLDRNGIIRMRGGDGMGDIMALYFDLIAEGEHRAMFRSLVHFARIEPVFVTPHSKRSEFRQWYQAFEECRYHTDPRVLRGFGAAGIVIERKTMLVRFPGETEQRQASGFYFYVPATAPVVLDESPTDLDNVPVALLLALVQRLEELPDEPDVCHYMRQPGAADYLWKNVLGPRGIALGQIDYAANVENRYGRPYFREPVRLFYDALNHGEFPYMADCFASMRVVTSLLSKVRQSIGLQAGARAQIRQTDFLRIVNDVALDLSRGKISVAFLFEQPSVQATLSMQRKLQQALSLCHTQSKEYEFLSVVRTALAGVLINIDFI